MWTNGFEARRSKTEPSSGSARARVFLPIIIGAACARTFLVIAHREPFSDQCRSVPGEEERERGGDIVCIGDSLIVSNAPTIEHLVARFCRRGYGPAPFALRPQP